MIRANNHLIVVLVCILCLCSGLVGPTLAASTTGSGSGPGDTQSSATTAAQPNQLNYTPLTAAETNNIVSSGASPSQSLQPLFIKNARTNEIQDPGDRVHAKDYTIDVGFVEVDLGNATEAIIQFVIDKMREGVKSLVTSFNEYIIGIPAPGEAQDPTTWSEGEQEWTAVYAVYGIMSALAIALLTPSFMVATDTVDRQKRRAYFIELSKAAFFIVLGIPITAFCLHLGDAVTMALAPGEFEFLASIENLSNIGVGLIFGAFLIYSKGILVAIGIVCTMLIRLLVYLSVAFWPIFWAFRVQPQDTIKGYGHMGISMFPLLILLRFTQAGILRFLFELPLDSIEGALFKLVATTGGLTIALIALPYAATMKLIPGSAMVLQNMQSSKISHDHDHKHNYSDNSRQYTQYDDDSRGPKSENPEPRAQNRLPPKYQNYATSKGPRSKNPDSRSSRRQSGGGYGRGSGNDGSSSSPTRDNSR